MRQVSDSRGERVQYVAPRPQPPADTPPPLSSSLTSTPTTSVSEINPRAASVAGPATMQREVIEFIYPNTPVRGTPAGGPLSMSLTSIPPSPAAQQPHSLQDARAQSVQAARTPGNFTYGYPPSESSSGPPSPGSVTRPKTAI